VVSLAESRLTVPLGRSAAADPVERLKELDPAAWQDLFTAFYKKMYSFAYVRTGDVEAAEDIAAEVFAAAAKGIHSYRVTGAPIGAWLYRIARNLTADHLEGRRKKPSVSLENVEVESPNWAAQLDERSDLLKGMAYLTRDHQEVLLLRFFNDCSVSETAKAMGKNEGAVRVIQHRALGALRRRLMLEAGPGRR
jgi:RNA polymerase sigma-70 factor (ECF subfamily)